MAQTPAWHLAAGPFLAACVLLVLAGVPKVADPMPLVRALRSVGLPAGRAAVRLLAVAEVLVGVVALVLPSRASAAAVCLGYLGFTAFVAVALRRVGVLSSCGCFGRADTPPTRSHLLVTAMLALAAGVVAARPPADGWTVASLVAPTSAVLLGFTALLAYLAYLVMAVLPATTPAAVRSAGTSRRAARTGRD